MKGKKYRKVIIDLFAQTIDVGGVNKSKGYVVNAYGNTTATSGNDFTPEKATYYHRVFLKSYEGELVHGQFGEKLTFPRHSGDIINIRGMSPYPTRTTALQEGVTPTSNLMNFYYIEAPVNQYGAYTMITDYARFASRDDVLTKDSEALASQAGRTIEELTVEALNAGQSVMYVPAYSNGAETAVNSRAALTNLSTFRVAVVFKALTYLENQHAKPINGSYVAIVHPNVKYDIMNDPNFISIVQYKNPERLYKGEIGTIGNVRFVVSTYAKKFAGAGAAVTQGSTTHFDVYSTLVLAEGAYKTLEIEGEGMQTIIKPLGSGGTSDPLNQRGTQGWKTTYGVVITGETCMLRIESTATLNYTTLSAESLFADQMYNRTHTTNLRSTVVA